MKKPMPPSNPDYDAGYKDGLTAFAHWKNGKQYIGAISGLLSQAISNRKQIWNYDPRKREEIK